MHGVRRARRRGGGIIVPPIPLAVQLAGAQLAWGLRTSTGWTTAPFKRPADGLPDGWAILGGGTPYVTTTKDSPAPLSGYDMDGLLFAPIHSNVEASQCRFNGGVSNPFGNWAVRLAPNGAVQNNVFIHHFEIDGGGRPGITATRSTLADHASGAARNIRIEDGWIRGSADDSIKLTGHGKILKRLRLDIGAWGIPLAHYDALSIDGQIGGATPDAIEDLYIDNTPDPSYPGGTFGRTSYINLGSSPNGGTIARIVGVGGESLDNGWANGTYDGPRGMAYGFYSGQPATSGWSLSNLALEFATAAYPAEPIGIVGLTNSYRISADALKNGQPIAAPANLSPARNRNPLFFSGLLNAA